MTAADCIQAHQQQSFPETRSYRNLSQQFAVCWHGRRPGAVDSVESDTTRCQLLTFKPPSSIWYEKLLRTSRQTCASREQILVMFAGGKWHLNGGYIWRYQPDYYLCQMCNNYAKRQSASMLQSIEFKNWLPWETFPVNIIFLFFPSPAVLIFPPESNST